MAKSPRTIYSSTQTKMIEYYSIDDICKTYTDTNWCSNETTVNDIKKSILLGGAFVIIPMDYDKRYLLTKTESDAKVVDNNSEEGYLTKGFYPPGVDDKVEEIVMSLAKPGSFFPVALQRYLFNVIDEYDLEQFPKVTNVDGKPMRGMSLVSFKIGEDDYQEMFEIDDNDIYLINNLTRGYGSSYSDLEFYDYYHVKDNFSEGYWNYDQYNEENQEKIKTIYMLLHPNWAEEDYRFERETFTQLYQDFSKLVPKILDDLMDITQYNINEEINDSLKDVITKELKEFFSSNGFSLDTVNNELTSNVGELYSWSVQLRRDFYTPKQFINTIFERISSNTKIGGWYEDYWSYQNSKFFDTDGFNVSIGRELDKVIETLEEEYNIEGWREISNKIYKEFPQGYSRPFPNYKNLQIVVDEIDPKTLMVKFKVQKGTQQRYFEMSYDKFNEFIYNKKLFDFESLLGF